MKWDDLYDYSKAAVEEAMSRLTGEREGKADAPKAGNEVVERVAGRLQDGGYVAAKLDERKRYDGERAYWRMRRRERRRKQWRVAAWTGVAACMALVCGTLLWMRGEVEPMQAVATGEAELLQPGQMRAVLVMSSGEQLVLDHEAREASEGEGVVIAIDSTGVSYQALDAGAEKEVVRNTLLVPRGGMYFLKLADGTQVWLNSDSRLDYPAVFPEGKREVRLSGEAYFAVARDTASPFVVRTERGNVRVLGTEFNVKCYVEEEMIATTLVAGKVDVSDGEGDHVVLEPGKQAVEREGVPGIAVREVNVEHYIGWRENRLAFQNETLERIMWTLARWYDIDVVFEDNGLRALEFSGNLDKYTDIDSFFRLFEMGSDARFERRGRTVYVRLKQK